MTTTREDWRRLAEGALDGPFERLTRAGLDGLTLAPLSARRPRDPPRLASRVGAWRVSQRVDHPESEAANRQALRDLEGGADALTLVARGSPFARGFGVSPDHLAQALGGVELDLISVRLDAGAETLAAARALCALVEARRWTSAELDLDLAYDPIGIEARLGRTPEPSHLRQILNLHDRAGLRGRPLLADCRAVHEAGATPAQELAYLIAAGVAHLRRLEALGLDLETARARIGLLVVVEADLVVSLAKVRAARRLWARIETASGLRAAPARLHAETSWRAMTRLDPWVNQMRINTGIAAAGLGGADVVTALPFTSVSGLADEGARRLARNAQRILIDEAHLAAVEDPAAGAGTFEDVADTLCADGWAGFLEIERDGGLAASMAAGRLQARLATSSRARERAFARQAEGLVGITRFPSLERTQIGNLDVVPREEPKPGPNALPVLRDAEPFERLRARVEALPVPPAIHVVALGAPAGFVARATLTANLFAVAGLSAPVPTVPGDPAQLAAALDDAASTRVACLVGSDDAYAASGRGTVEALRAAGASLVLVASPDDAPPFGADRQVNDTCDLVELLEATLTALGVG